MQLCLNIILTVIICTYILYLHTYISSECIIFSQVYHGIPRLCTESAGPARCISFVNLN
uniref:Uncharacterized protein n=1 Tax=Anguilla anguilla TaxID=7936 RepID=A0A0E9S914_ANGAN